MKLPSPQVAYDAVTQLGESVVGVHHLVRTITYDWLILSQLRAYLVNILCDESAIKGIQVIKCTYVTPHHQMRYKSEIQKLRY